MDWSVEEVHKKLVSLGVDPNRVCDTRALHAVDIIVGCGLHPCRLCIDAGHCDMMMDELSLREMNNKCMGVKPGEIAERLSAQEIDRAVSYIHNYFYRRGFSLTEYSGDLQRMAEAEENSTIGKSRHFANQNVGIVKHFDYGDDAAIRARKEAMQRANVSPMRKFLRSKQILEATKWPSHEEFEQDVTAVPVFVRMFDLLNPKHQLEEAVLKMNAEKREQSWVKWRERNPVSMTPAQYNERLKSRVATLRGGQSIHDGWVDNMLEPDYLPVVFLSHRWEKRGEPDPNCTQLAAIQEMIRATALDAFWFYDYSSLKQHPRTEEEEDLFQLELTRLASLVVKSKLLILSHATFFERAWCFFESIVHEELDTDVIGTVSTLSSALEKRSEFSGWAWNVNTVQEDSPYTSQAVFRAYSDQSFEDFLKKDKHRFLRIVGSLKVTNGHDLGFVLSTMYNFYRIVDSSKRVIIAYDPIKMDILESMRQSEGYSVKDVLRRVENAHLI